MESVNPLWLQRQTRSIMLPNEPTLLCCFWIERNVKKKMYHCNKFLSVTWIVAGARGEVWKWFEERGDSSPTTYWKRSCGVNNLYITTTKIFKMGATKTEESTYSYQLQPKQAPERYHRQDWKNLQRYNCQAQFLRLNYESGILSIAYPGDIYSTVPQRQSLGLKSMSTRERMKLLLFGQKEVLYVLLCLVCVNFEKSFGKEVCQ